MSRKAILLTTLIPIVALTMGCTGHGDTSSELSGNNPLSKNTQNIIQEAMSIYAYHPGQALHIIDSAVIVGNLSELQADIYRAKIYSMTLMFEQVDMILGGPEGIRLDSARAIGERLLRNESVKSDLSTQKNILEVLVYTSRMQNDTIMWLQWSRKLVNVCHGLGTEAETDALRTEAEIGAALCAMGQLKTGMAKLDSVITCLSPIVSTGEVRKKGEQPEWGFDELDALIIALKRKIVILSSQKMYAETLPLSRRIIELLDDYEQHPDDYHDGSIREPKNDQKREKYINFYRNQAQNFIAAAYASLGESGNMLESFKQIESSVRNAMAREQIAQYNALQLQMEAEREHAKYKRANIIIVSTFLLLVVVFTIIVTLKNRAISRKNRLLAQQVARATNYQRMYWDEKNIQETPSSTNAKTMTDEQLFQHVNDTIIRERLFLDPKFERQTVMERFGLSKERVGAIFSKGSGYAKMSTYIQQLRLEYAAKLLSEQPDKSIKQVAEECGFGSHTYFSACFRQQFDISPTDYRSKLKK